MIYVTVLVSTQLWKLSETSKKLCRIMLFYFSGSASKIPFFLSLRALMPVVGEIHIFTVPRSVFVLRQNDLERIFVNNGIDGGFTVRQSAQLLSEFR